MHCIYDKRNKMLHISGKMIMWKAKIIFKEKTTILPLEICLLPVKADVKNHVNRWTFSQKKNHNCSKRYILHDQ